MKFKKLRIKNIRSYKNEEIIFPEGSLLLAGNIGSGKSSILLAIEYALFGLQPGQRGSALLRNNAPSGEVALEMEVNGKEILIERKLKRSNKTISNEYAALTMDGEKIESSVTELKTKILTFLGYPAEFIKKNNLLYRYTVYTPQEEMKQIILEDPETRLNILRHIFGIDKYKRIRENLSLILVLLKEEVKLLQGKVSAIEQDKDFLIQNNKRLGELKIEIENKQYALSEKVSFRKKIELESLQLKEKIQDREVLENETEKTKILLTTKNEDISSIISEINEIEKSLSEQKKVFDELKYQEILKELELTNINLDIFSNKYLDILSNINSLKKEQASTAEKKERVFSIDICPTCLQDVPESHKHNILNETESLLSSLKNKLSSYEVERTELLQQQEKLKKTKLDLETQKLELEIAKSNLEYIRKSKEKLVLLKKRKENLEKDVSLLLKHMEGLKLNILQMSKFDNLYSKKEQELKSAFSEEKLAEIGIAELKKESELTQRTINTLEKILSEKESAKQKLSELQDLSDWLSNSFAGLIEFIERNVLLKLRAEFSNLFNKWFNMLVTDESLQVRLDENFTPLILQNQTEMDYSFLSGGERTAVALAYRLALNQTINSVLSQIKTRDIIILDEPTDGLSELQVDKIKDILEELNAAQLIIVSHEQKIEGFVDHTIRVKKESGASEVESS